MKKHFENTYFAFCIWNTKRKSIWYFAFEIVNLKSILHFVFKCFYGTILYISVNLWWSYFVLYYWNEVPYRALWKGARRKKFVRKVVTTLFDQRILPPPLMCVRVSGGGRPRCMLSRALVAPSGVSVYNNKYYYYLKKIKFYYNSFTN